jgi:anti-sigma regulatory factor (Ser/Thr protein kinase)
MSIFSAFSNRLDAITFDLLLKQRNPWKTSRFEIDLHGFDFISPTVMAMLVSTIRYSGNIGYRPLVKVDDLSVRSYLTRTRCLLEILPFADIEPEITASDLASIPSAWGLNNELIEVTPIDQNALQSIPSSVITLLHGNFQYPALHAYEIASAVSEVCQNTIDHNRIACGFFVMQVYRPLGGDRFVEIGVSDYGCGIQESLKRNPKYQTIGDDLSAIHAATQQGVTSSNDPTRGMGLAHLLEITEKRKGTVQIRSGCATARYRFDKIKAHGFSVTWLPGVHISLQLHESLP